jgi:hypothetical protein
MPPKNKTEKLRDNVAKELRSIKTQLDPRTYAAYERDIYNAVGPSALYKLSGKFETIKESKDKAPTKTAKAKETNKINKIKNKEAIEYFKKPLIKYNIKADLNITNTYTKARKSNYNKNGRKKGEVYEHVFEKPLIVNDYSKIVEARSEDEALNEYIRIVYNENDLDKPDWAPDTTFWKTSKLNAVNNVQLVNTTAFESASPETMMMKLYKPLQYNFIPSDDKLLVNPGFCVPDQFVSTYSKFIKSLNFDHFIDLCYRVRGETRNETKQKSLLDVDIKDDEDDDKTPKRWDITDGVSPKMLTDICKILNISTYAYDITQNCFLKNISTSRNYPAFIYYAVNNHCYHITNKDTAKSLVEKAKDIEHKIKSNCIIEEQIKKDDKFEKLQILEDIPIENLMQYENCIIIYKQNDLNNELNKIIEVYNYIPKIKNHKFDIVNITFDKDDKNIHLYVDPNDDVICDYKYIKSECEKLNIPFKNQSFAQLITQLKRRYYDNINKRKVFNMCERIELWKLKDHVCSTCHKDVKATNFQIDHIKPLSIGGTNEMSNLQILCKQCHTEKTRGEQEQGYFKSSDTESSFNSITKSIFDSSLYGSYAFIESICDKIPKKMINNKIFSIDKNKCRKNILYYQKYAYPLFTVMDKPTEYKGQTGAGIYYIETEQYFPFRGNGWYSYPLIKYGLDNELIKASEIKYVIESSLEVPHDYFNEFIDYLYSNVEEAKLSVNSMIGNFKPKPRESWKSELITVDPSEAFYHYLRSKSSFIDVRIINEVKYYQVYSTSTISKEETDAPIYNQILDIEAMEMHKLKCIIESKNGLCLDVKTDCITCMFQNDIFPFEMADDVNLSGFYYDDDMKMPKYKLEPCLGRLVIPRMEKYKRSAFYNHVNIEWTEHKDIDSNDFSILVNQVLDSKKSINIDGRAGTGKSTLINMLQAEMKNRGISFKCLAPTNKAARVVNGSTIHKFVLSHSSRKIMTDDKFDYLFIDEISMIHEYFYKFLITLKRVRPTLKFIVAGDFSQLLPVNDRLECDYKESPALHELCSGQRLQLSKCRRADDTLFKLTDPNNIHNLTKSDFNQSKDEYYSKSLCFTNNKRKQINTIMMNKYIDMKTQEAKQKKKAPPTPVILKCKEGDEMGQDVKLLKGMPIIARKTTEKYDIMNNETFNIYDINKETFKIIVHQSPIEISIKEFQELFNVAFCMTVFKSQGQTFNENYSIFEWERFDKRMKYVSLSRATDKKYIHIH